MWLEDRTVCGRRSLQAVKSNSSLEGYFLITEQLMPSYYKIT